MGRRKKIQEKYKIKHKYKKINGEKVTRKYVNKKGKNGKLKRIQKKRKYQPKTKKRKENVTENQENNETKTTGHERKLHSRNSASTPRFTSHIFLLFS